MVLTDGLVAYYKLNEASGAVIDELGAANGTNNGATANVAAKIGTGYDFEKTESDYITMGDKNDVTSGEMSISLWVKLESVGGGQQFFVGKDQAGGRAYAFGLDGNDKPTFQIAGNGMGAASPSALSAGVWYHLVGTFVDATNAIKIYLNGSPFHTTTSAGVLTNVATDFTIGRRMYGGGEEGYTDGIIDEVGIWDRALSDDEVSTLYNSNSGLTYPFVLPPVAAFTSNAVVGTVPATINFTDQSTNTPTSWLWDFGDGDTSAEQSPSHIYATAGTYTVSLTATNAGGNDAEVKINYITISDPLPVTYKVGQAMLRTKYPITDGITARTTTQEGHVMQLIPEKSFVINRQRAGLL